jgi:MFS family permease
LARTLKKLRNLYYGWIVLAAGFATAMFVGGAVYYSFTALIDPIANEFGWTYAQISFAASLRGMEMSLLAPFVGMLLDRYGARRPMVIGVIICGAGLILLSRTQTLLVYYLAFVLVTLGSSGTSMTAMMTVVVQWFRRRIGIANGIMVSGFAAGGVLIPVVNALIDNFGWRVSLLAQGAAMFVVVLPLVLLIRRRPDMTKASAVYEMGETPPAATETAAEPATAALSTGEDFTARQALRSRAFWHLVIGFIIIAYTLTAVITFVMPYLGDLEMNRTTAALIAMLIPITSIIGRLAMGWLSDRFRPRSILAVATVMLGVGILCFGLVSVSGPGWLVPFLLFFTLGMGGTIALRPALVRHYFGRARFGAVFGLIMGTTMLGTITSPGLTGWVYDITGNYDSIWFIYGGISLLALLPILTCPKATAAKVSPDVTAPGIGFGD